MTTISEPTLEAQASLSPFGRIAGVFFNPAQTFVDIARQPSWLLPLALLVLVSVGIGIELAQRVNWEQYIGRKLDASPSAAQLSPEQRQQRIEVGAKYARISCYVVAPIGMPVTLLFFAALYLGAFNLLANARLRFGQSAGIVAHAMMPSLVSGILATIVLAVKDPGTIDPQQPLASSVYAFLPDDAPQWLQSLGSSIELFFLWMLVLVSIGFAAANPRKATLGKAFGIVFGLWGAWVLGKVIWAVL
ncbi:MAG TPA: YIP1 family protein [Methylomirabilota bacterium]|nr:YIP1 family protein [Methylomirabilota bacterium]